MKKPVVLSNYEFLKKFKAKLIRNEQIKEIQ